MSSFTWTLGIKITPDGLMPCALNDPGFFTEIEGVGTVRGNEITELHLQETVFQYGRYVTRPGAEISGKLFDQIESLLWKHCKWDVQDAIAEWKADAVNQAADYRRKVSA